MIRVVEVTVRDHEPLERALKRFKKKWERAGVLREVRRKSYYVKPSDDKRATRKKAIRRMARLARIQALRDEAELRIENFIEKVRGFSLNLFIFVKFTL